jgi:hypothetical protein
MTGRRRSVRKFGAVAALFALALQFVLSFGHMHPEDFFPAMAQPATQAGTPAAPSKPAPIIPTDDACAICVNMAMMGAVAIPPPPAPILPEFVFARAIFPQLVAEAPRWTVRVSFRSRAPPSV